MNVQEAEAKFTEALDAAVAAGYTLVYDVWGAEGEKKCCCAMGAIALMTKTGENTIYDKIYPLYKAFDESGQEAENSTNFWSIITGFFPLDAVNTTSGKPEGPWYELGRKLSDKYKPVRFHQT